MATKIINGVSIFYEAAGSGDPLILVHGSWTDHHSWDLVAPELARHFHVITYDRRGHSQSERPEGQGSVREDAADLAALIEELGLAPAHVAGNSFGASITLRLASERPELFRTLIAHEPPLFGLLEDTPESAPLLEEVRNRIQAVVEELAAGHMEAGARRFAETIALGPGSWDNQLTPETRETFIRNAPTWLDEVRDPEALHIDLDALGGFAQPALISTATASPPLFPPVVARLVQALPKAERLDFPGAGHMPHLSHPREYVEAVLSFVTHAGERLAP